MCDVLYSQSHAFKRVQYHQIRIYERSWAQKTDSSKHKKMSGKKSERERVRRISESPAVFVLYTVTSSMESYRQYSHIRVRYLKYRHMIIRIA